MRLRRGRGPKDIVIDAGVRVRGLKDGYAVSSEYSVHPLAKAAIVLHLDYECLGLGM
jgi:hypothetical protein